MRYFIQKTHCCPESFAKFGFTEIENGLYRQDSDGSLWKARDLADFGWGIEHGLCRLPELSFDELILLAMVDFKEPKFRWFWSKSKEEKFKDSYYNFYGAIAVLLTDHCDAFLDYLFQNYTPEQLEKDYPELFKYVSHCHPLYPEYITDVKILNRSLRIMKWLNEDWEDYLNRYNSK